MAKYWLFLDNQVTGPYNPEELRNLPGFGPEALICPEGRKGTDMGDWQRAGLVQELRGASRMTAQMVATQEDVESALPGALEEPSPFSLPDTNSEEKISSLELAFGGLHEQVRKDEDDMLNLHRILDDERKSLDHWIRDISGKMSRIEEKVGGSLESSRKEIEDFKREAEEGRRALLAKIQDMEQMLSMLPEVKARVESADAAQKETEALAKSEADSIEEMKRSIEALQSEISLLRGRAFGIGNGPESHAPSAPEQSSLHTESPGLQASAPESPSFSLPPEPQATAGAEPSASVPGERFEPPAANDFSLPPFPGETSPETQPAAASEPAAMDFLQAQNVPPQLAEPSPAAASGPIDIAPAVARAQPKLKKVKGKAFVWVGLVLVAAGALFAFEEGLIPLGQNKAPTPVVPPTPAAPVVSQQAAAEDGFKKQAIAMVQNRKLPNGKTIGEVLGTMAPTSGNLSPWMADKASDGVYQVNFYGSKAQNGPIMNYQFEARLDDQPDQQVIGLNALAQNLLTPPSPTRSAKRHYLRKVKPRMRKPVIHIRPMRKAEKNIPIKSLPGLGEPPQKPQVENPQQQGAAQSKGQAPSSKGQAQDAQLLDNLLKP